MAELMERGGKVYASNCAVCHQPTGKGAGAFPALDGSKIANGPIAEHVSIVLKGKNAMPSWAPTLNDVEIASVITFERNSWGNHTGDILQPKQVADARNGKLPEGGDHLAAQAGAAERRHAAARRLRAAASGGSREAQRGVAGRPPATDAAARSRQHCRPASTSKPARARCRPTRKRQSQAAAAYAKAHPDAKFTLSGFTDATGSADLNAKLAKSRARSRARRAEGSRHRRRPHYFEEAGNDHGRQRRERSPACSDQSGCLTCSWSAPQYSL